MNLLLVACDKDDDPSSQELPQWLQEEINGLVSSSSKINLCDVCNVDFIEFNGKRYYDLYCGHWSCRYCHLYDEDGILVEWSQEDWGDFIETHKVIRTVPMCRD